MKDIKHQLILRALLHWSIFALVFSVALETFNGTKIISAQHPLGIALVMVATLAAIKFSMEKTTYLNFLGPTFLPPNLLQIETKPKDATLQIEIITPNNTVAVVYWAADASQNVNPDVWKAYGNYNNSGVASVSQGKALLSLWCPGRYQVGTVKRKTLPKHVHYRFVSKEGMLSAVQTKYLMCV
jgi:hypothetical protein